MMQLLCNGVVLDLYDGTSLQFTHKNPLFAFDKLECERTTQFKLPSTPTNDRVLELARIPAYKGTGMRQRFAAELQAGTVVKSGYLYVSEYDGTDYTAVFVTGELVGLQAIRNAGKVRDVLQYDQTILWNDSAVVAANGGTIANIALVDYEKKTSHVNPSMSLRWLIEEMAAAIGAQVNFTNTDAATRVRLFESTEDYGLDDWQATMSYDANNPEGTTITPRMGVLKYHTATAYVWRANSIQGSFGIEWDEYNAEQLEAVDFRQISCNYKMVLTFAEDTPANLCLVTGDLVERSTLNDTLNQIHFIDERQFSKSGSTTVYTGEPLAGRRVEVDAYTPFFLLSGDGYWYTQPTALDQEADIGYYVENAMSYVVDIQISIDHKWEYGEYIPYNALLPSMTLVDLLKMYAYMTGTLLYYDGTVKFDLLNLAAFTLKQADTLTKQGQVKRTFADYAQRNLVQYDSAEYVLQGERIMTEYTIDNENLDEEKELATLKVSEGRRRLNGTNERIYIPDYDGGFTAANASITDAKMLRVPLPKNANIQALCTASTQFVVEAHMTMMEYNAITAKTLLLIDGTKYTWTDRSWQNDVAKFTLAKV
jgi:hypothetical protein